MKKVAASLWWLVLVGCGAPASGAKDTTAEASTADPVASAPKSQVVSPGCAELDYEGCKAACEKGTATACTTAALAVDEERRGTEAQRATYGSLLEKGCEGGDAEACRRLGLALAEGRGVAKDEARAKTLLSKAFAANKSGCDAGRAEACTLQGFMTEQGWATTADEAAGKALRKKAIELYAAACEGGDSASCARAGEALEQGFYLDKDGARAKKLLESGCKADGAESCFLIGLGMLFGTSGSSKDEAGAASYLEKACKLGSSRGCNTYGEQLAEGKGLPKNPKVALEMLERACHGPGDQLIATACLAAAEVRVSLGEAKTSDKVRALAEKSCRLGFQNGCDVK